MMRDTIAVIAPGAMGAAIAGRLAANGVDVVTSLAGRSTASASRAEAAGMRAVDDETLGRVDILLSVVPPNEALPLAQRISRISRSSEKPLVYADLNAINPETTRQVGEVVTAAGAIYVDGGIIGMPPREGYAGPTIYVSGPETRHIEALSAYGLRISRVDDRIGSASALKLSYAGITKGLIAIGSAMILAADRHEVGSALRAELALSQPRLLEGFSRSIPDMFSKAGRWVPEMEEIAAFVGTGRPEAEIYHSIAGLYSRLASYSGKDGEIADLAAFFTSPPQANEA